MRTDDEMQEEFDRNSDVAYRDQLTENFKRIPPELGKMRMVVVCFPFYGNAGEYLDHIFPDRKAKTFSNPLSAESRLLSSALLRAWTERFAQHVRTGNGASSYVGLHSMTDIPAVTGHVQILQNLIQGGQEFSEAALSVD